MTVLQAQDVYVAALCIWREMRGESDLARLGCYWVIRNRANDARNRWPKSFYGVVTQKYQFSSFNPGDPNASLLPHEGNIPDWKAWLECATIVDAPGDDPVAGANAYECLPDNVARPGWAMSARMVKQIGKTRFYVLP